MTFLQLVASDLKLRYPEKLSEVTLVFPNRRAALFFNKYLTEGIEKPLWAPKTVTMNDTMLQVSELKLAHPMTLIMDLYRIYCNVTGTQEPFDDFYFWGEVLLADFDQIDKHLVDAPKLFANIKDLRELDSRFDGLTDEQRKALAEYLGVMELESALKMKYIDIWEKLGAVYLEFTNLLVTKGQCYEGLAYRRATEHLNDAPRASLFDEPTVFVGFNALNRCEHRLLSHFKRKGNALFYWDYIPIFEGESPNEAYSFIHENMKLYPNALSKEQLIATKTVPQVTIIAASNLASQAKLVPQLLLTITQGGDTIDEKTALVLPQENLMIPVLRSLPNIESGVNVTIGYPLRETPAYGLAELLVRLQINSRMDKENALQFYHRDVIAILNHPYVRACEPEATKLMVKYIKTNNQIYPFAGFLGSTPLLTFIFRKVEGVTLLNDYLLGACTRIANAMSNVAPDNRFSTSVNLEFLLVLYKSLNTLKSNLSKFDIEIGPRVFFQILRKAFMQERVSFTGEPLAGLQVMGFLESRALDFENLVILSFNDDLLPGQSSSISFITPSLRTAFGLPNFKHHEAVYAYNFYRLLYRAKQVFLIYSGRTEGGKSGEMSRYGLQLEMEYMPNEVRRIDIGYSLGMVMVNPIALNKSDVVMRDLKANLTKNGEEVTLSPSGITAYITCPLKFYFRYGLRLQEASEVSEEVNAIEFGKIIHSTIEALYKPFCGAQVEDRHLNSLLANPSQMEATLDESFSIHFLKNSTLTNTSQLTGRNLLIRNALLHMVKRMIAVDIQRTPFILVSHEATVAFTLPTNSALLNGKVTIKGTIDRLEGNATGYTVIDFKTGSGSGKGKFKELTDLFVQEKIGKTKEVFQIFCYSLGVLESLNAQSVLPAVWFVRTVMPGDTPQVAQTTGNTSNPVANFAPFAQDFKLKLTELVNEIFDPSLPFSQTHHAESCKICPYRGICNR